MLGMQEMAVQRIGREGKLGREGIVGMKCGKEKIKQKSSLK